MSHRRNRSRYSRQERVDGSVVPHSRNEQNRPQVPAPCRPKRAQVPEKQLTRQQAIKDVLTALDGYSNATAFLGEDSPLMSSGTFHRSGLTANTELLTVTYRENWLAKRIIDMP